MSLFDEVKNLLKPEPLPETQFIVISSFNPEELPLGFFNVVTAAGKTSLGYHGGFVTYDCGETVVDGAKRVTLDKKREELPTVKLDYNRRGVGDYTIITTDSLESNDGSVTWDGAPPSSGVQWR
jgi:hypothetical protein